MRRAAYIVAALTAILCAAWRYQDMPMRECAWCFKPATLFNPFERHHIYPQASYPVLVDEPANIIVMHRRCQFVLGHRCDYKTFNPDVREICMLYTNTLPNRRAQ